MDEWKKTKTQNLFVYVPAATYYARLKIRGKVYRKKIEAASYIMAKEKLPGALDEIRKEAATTSIEGVRTIEDARKLAEARMQKEPGIAQSTKTHYASVYLALGPGGAGELPSHSTPDALRDWWQKVDANYAPQQANHLLTMARKVYGVAIEGGLLKADPTRFLKRLRVVRKDRALLTAEQFDRLVAHIRGHRKALSDACADWIEWAAYTGMRPGEMLLVEWSDIGEDSIRVRGGKTLNQTGVQRQPVPIISRMRDFLTRLRSRSDQVGRVFPRADRPRGDALSTACQKLGLPHQRTYDLRHQFATMAIASGVDVPTVSRWLGHKDGGALVMRTYVHPDQSHSVESAKKVKW